MHAGDQVPRVDPQTSMKDVLFEMTRKRLGMTTVVDGDGRLLGMISDGDLRRQMERHGYTLLDRTAEECMTTEPVVIGRRELATAALALMEERQITSLPWWPTRAPRRRRRPPPRPVEDGDDLKDAGACRALPRLRLVLTDVDGVLTDGTLLLLPDGGEAKALPRPRRPRPRAGAPRRPASWASSRAAAATSWRGARASWASRSCARASRTRGAALRRDPGRARPRAGRGRLHGRRRQRPAVHDRGRPLAPRPPTRRSRCAPQAFMVTDARGGHGCLARVPGSDPPRARATGSASSHAYGATAL